MAFQSRVNVFKPFAGMNAFEIGVASTCRLLAAVLVLGVIAFVLRATTPFVIADAWFYVSKVIRPWQEGHLSVADFFVTRGPSDHMQPIYRLVLLMHTAWFHMDFTVEALIGVAFAIACVYLWYRLARSMLAKAPRMTVTTQLTGLALVAVVFSLNARGVYDWPLVTLAFMGIFVVSALLAATPVMAEKGTIPAFAGLAGLALLVFLVDDTYGILAVICAVVLLALMRLRRQVGHDAWLRSTLVLVAVAIAYIAICRVLFPYVGATASGQGLAPLLTLLKAHWRESWKLIVIPAGTPIAGPQRIEQGLGISLWAVPRVLVALAIPVCAANVWFWVNYLRRKPNTLIFTAAGLMLFFYFSLAAILVSRLPRFGFDYLHEGRYMQVYELQLVAVLMMSAQVLSEQPDARLHKGVLASLVLLFVALTVSYGFMARREIHSIRAYQQRIAEQIEQFGADPSSPPKDCMANFITPCSHWSMSARVEVFQTLERGPYNVFSPAFRKWHRRQIPKTWSWPISPGLHVLHVHGDRGPPGTESGLGGEEDVPVNPHPADVGIPSTRTTDRT